MKGEVVCSDLFHKVVYYFNITMQPLSLKAV